MKMRKKLTNKLEKLLNKHWGVYVGIIVVLLIFIGYTLSALSTSKLAFLTTEKKSQEVSLYEGSFVAPRITAESAIVWDVRANRPIYEKNADKAKPLASITKIMTALTAIENVPRDTEVSIDYNALAQDGESGLVAGEKWTLTDLIDFSLIESSNDGIAAVASAVGAIHEGLPNERAMGRLSFIDMMNQKAKELGLTHTKFENESGLDIWNETESGASGSARDVAKLFSYVLTEYPEIFEATTHSSASFTSLSGSTYTAKNTNQALSAIPNLIGSKTGYTNISGGNLGVIVDPGINYPFVIVVLGSTFEERFRDVVALSEATLRYLSPPNN